VWFIAIKICRLSKLIEGITMKSSPGNQDKQAARKTNLKTSITSKKAVAKEDASTAPIGRVVTEEHYRARVSQKAYGLYEKRQAMTSVDDWLEAERVVKTELLAEGQAGSV
jgi:hypothetical protein